jgi:hypothetical protein
MQQKRNDHGELNFYLLKCLVALVDHSHVSRAAKALSVSHPAHMRFRDQVTRSLEAKDAMSYVQGG